MRESVAEAWAAVGLPSEKGKFRQRPPRRFNARIVFGGLGLLAVLVTVAIIGLLGSRVVSDVGDDDPLRDAGVLDDPSELVGGTGDETEAACDLSRRTLEIAVSAYEAMYGELPPDEDALVGDLLESPVEQWDYRLVEGRASYEGVGACKGR